MKKTSYSLLLLTGASLAGCGTDADLPSPDNLIGTWRLTDRACYCAAAPIPDEVITFDNNQRFQIVRNGALAAEGTYALSRAPACGESADRDQLRFEVATAGAYAPTGAYAVQYRTLVIDQTNKCISDGPVYTYTRQP
jgi:hypothetical protein